MAKALKRMMAAEYEAELAEVDGVVVVDPGPMTVADTRAFRKDLREKAGGARLTVVHNRTARNALGRTLYRDRPEALQAILKGPSAIVYGGEGPVPIAKVVREWRRKLKALRVKGATLEGEVIEGADLERLADMPSLPQVRSMLLSAILGPARGLASVMAAAYGGIPRALQARIDAQGGSQGGGEEAGATTNQGSLEQA